MARKSRLTQAAEIAAIAATLIAIGSLLGLFGSGSATTGSQSPAVASTQAVPTATTPSTGDHHALDWRTISDSLANVGAAVRAWGSHRTWWGLCLWGLLAWIITAIMTYRSTRWADDKRPESEHLSFGKISTSLLVGYAPIGLYVGVFWNSLEWWGVAIIAFLGIIAAISGIAQRIGQL